MGGIKLSTHTTKKFLHIGLFFFAAYLLMAYVANDIVISSRFNTYTLYAFIAWGLITILISYGDARSIFTSYTWWYLLLLVISLVTMLYSPETDLFSEQFYLMIVSFVITFIVQLFVNNADDFKFLCWCYAISSVILMFILLVTDNLHGTDSNRLGNDFASNANNFAMIMMVAVMYSIWLVVCGNQKKIYKIIIILIVVFDMYGLALSAGRKFFVVPLIFLYFLLLTKNESHNRKILKTTAWFAILIFVVFFLIFNTTSLYEAIGIRFERMLWGQDGSATIRSEMRVLAIKEWIKSPLWGFGFDSFKYLGEKVLNFKAYSHCNFTEMLYSGGILLFIAYYWIYYKIFRTAKSAIKVDNSFKAFAVATAASMLVFDYGAVSYSLAAVQMMLMLSIKVLTFKESSQEIGREGLV